MRVSLLLLGLAAALPAARASEAPERRYADYSIKVVDGEAYYSDGRPATGTPPTFLGPGAVTHPSGLALAFSTAPARVTLPLPDGRASGRPLAALEDGPTATPQPGSEGFTPSEPRPRSSSLLGGAGDAGSVVVFGLIMSVVGIPFVIAGAVLAFVFDLFARPGGWIVLLLLAAAVRRRPFLSLAAFWVCAAAAVAARVSLSHLETWQKMPKYKVEAQADADAFLISAAVSAAIFTAATYAAWFLPKPAPSQGASFWSRPLPRPPKVRWDPLVTGLLAALFLPWFTLPALWKVSMSVQAALARSLGHSSHMAAPWYLKNVHLTFLPAFWTLTASAVVWIRTGWLEALLILLGSALVYVPLAALLGA